MKTKKNKLNSVKLMRKIRNELSREYFENPDKFYQELEKIRKKYDLIPSEKPNSSSSD